MSTTRVRHSRVKSSMTREDAEAPSARPGCPPRSRGDQRRLRLLGNRHRRPCTESPFAATALAHHQSFFLVEPVELLAIELDALAFQHQVQDDGSRTAAVVDASSRSLPAKRFIERPLRSISIHLRMQTRRDHRLAAASSPSPGSPRSTARFRKLGVRSFFRASP